MYPRRPRLAKRLTTPGVLLTIRKKFHPPAICIFLCGIFYSRARRRWCTNRVSLSRSLDRNGESSRMSDCKNRTHQRSCLFIKSPFDGVVLSTNASGAIKRLYNTGGRTEEGGSHLLVYRFSRGQSDGRARRVNRGK